MEMKLPSILHSELMILTLGVCGLMARVEVCS